MSSPIAGAGSSAITTSAISDALAKFGAYTVSVVKDAGTLVTSNLWIAGPLLGIGNFLFATTAIKVGSLVDKIFAEEKIGRAAHLSAKILVGVVVLSAITAANLAVAPLLPLSGFASATIAIGTVGLAIIFSYLREKLPTSTSGNAAKI